MAVKVVGRPMYNHALMCDIFEREKRFCKINEQFIPNLKATSVTGKFYSAHDVVREGDIDPELVAMIQEIYRKGPTDKWDYPATENQWIHRKCEFDLDDAQMGFHNAFETREALFSIDVLLQSYGWYSDMIDENRTDRRLEFHRPYTDVSIFGAFLHKNKHILRK